MATFTPTRRVLSDLNVNTPIAPSVAKSPKSKSSSVTEQATLGEVLLSTPQKEVSADSMHEYTTTGSTKRRSNALNPYQEHEPSRKKSRISSLQTSPKTSWQAAKGGDASSPSAIHSKGDFGPTAKGSDMESEESSLEEVGIRGNQNVRRRLAAVNVDSGTQSRSVSPDSLPDNSFVSDSAGLNDSQNTIITEPDEIMFPTSEASPPNRLTRLVLTTEQLREKAKEMKLRLSLASYKVRTNQIDIPISHLEIRSSASGSKRPRTALNRLSLPTISTNLPDITLQEPSAEKKQPHAITITSSPPIPYQHRSFQSYKQVSPTKEKDATPQGSSTPLLPRQRDGLLNPPNLESSTWEDKKIDVTSSVIKGRAADGLLSLMHDQN